MVDYSFRMDHYLIEGHQSCTIFAKTLRGLRRTPRVLQIPKFILLKPKTEIKSVHVLVVAKNAIGSLFMNFIKVELVLAGI